MEWRRYRPYFSTPPSDAPRMELIVWGSTAGIFTSSAFQAYSRFKKMRSKAGNIKPGSTGPRFWTSLTMLGQFLGCTVPPLVYWTATAYNKFQQPRWMTEHALPSPPDVFGVNGVMVGRMTGLLVFLAGTILAQAGLEFLGDQYNPIGVSDPIFAWVTDVDSGLRLFRAVDKGET
jgi:hypothetical protein